MTSTVCVALAMLLSAPLALGVPPATAPHILANDAVSATISAGRLVALRSQKTDGATGVEVAGDDFTIELDGAPATPSTTILSSAKSTRPPTVLPGVRHFHRPDLHHFDCIWLTVRGRIWPQGVTVSWLRFRLADDVLI